MRSELIYDSRLASAARAKARDMGDRRYLGHKDPEGIGANYSVTAAGYKLPTNYMAFRGSNQIESLAGGKSSAQETIDQLTGSWTHES